ncbi:MAG: cytochrome c biogenesis protein CcsA [Bacteroidaceae bacterium]|nr:cytochrome c biogenesis protein CcsA [Bacteroidaceae bacterium]
MTWQHFIYFALPAVLLWAAGAGMAWRRRQLLAHLLTLLGIGVFGAFIVALWISLERPPLRTMGETRLWYALFLPTTGLLVYGRWRYPWILAFSTLLATVFTTVNIVQPDIHNKTLMPALQSPWFAPHVIIYMFAYAMLGAAAVMAIYLLWFKKRAANDHELDICDNLVHVGWAMMTIGILFGALWAKEAWGHYWSWDPKETWAAATWWAYLVYIHLRLRPTHHRRAALWWLIFSFVLLQMCWWGINYLPAAQGTSVHTYNMG